MVAGAIFAKALVRAGLYIAATVEYPSLIRGGHNAYLIRASETEIFSLVKTVDLLVALNEETIRLHQDELTDRALVLYDKELIHSNDLYHPTRQKNDSRFFPVPFLKLATENGGEKIMMNNVALGASWAVIDLPFEILAGVIADVFAKKGQEIIKENTEAAKAGYDYLKKNFADDSSFKLKKRKALARLVLTGNEAIGLGALRAGMKFAAIYPMTPINGLLNFLASHEKEGGYLYQQPEDEIAGINMAIGASYAGARSLVATSGGGFDLMVEGYSMSAMTETPLVIVMGTRPGPSSGLPTWTGQGDLKFMLSASQGDFLRVVLAPGDPLECFELIQTAFNLADRYQTPVILLVDKFLCESIGTIKELDLQKVNLATAFYIPTGNKNEEAKLENYKRYKLTESGISSRALPGQTFFITNSYEHDEAGFSTEDASEIKKMVEKRARKDALLAKEAPEPMVYGDKNADITLVGWGSTKGAAREAIKIWNMEHKTPNINYLHLNWINPFPKEAVKRILSKAKKVIDVEENFTGQMAGWIREQTGIEIKDKILKYDGRPFYAEDIIEGVKKYA